MKKIATLALFASMAFASMAQGNLDINRVTHYWTVGFNGATKFFFATYYPGGSNIFTIDASYTHLLADNHWQLGGGLGIGGGASTKQYYLGPARDTVGSNNRNPMVIPIFGRAKYIVNPRRTSSLYANMDFGYMLSLVTRHDGRAMPYYCLYGSPSIGYQFGARGTRTKVSAGLGLNAYMEHREELFAPYGRHYNLQLDFLGYVTFDFGCRKYTRKPKITAE